MHLLEVAMRVVMPTADQLAMGFCPRLVMLSGVIQAASHPAAVLEAENSKRVGAAHMMCQRWQARASV